MPVNQNTTFYIFHPVPLSNQLAVVTAALPFCCEQPDSALCGTKSRYIIGLKLSNTVWQL